MNKELKETNELNESNEYTNKVKETVRKLKEYTYPHEGKEVNPIAIMGPAGDETKLRVYSFGGEIGEISTKPSEQCSLANEKDKDGKYSYGKYLKDGHINGRKHRFYFSQIEEQINHLKEKHAFYSLEEDELYKEFERISNESKTNKSEYKHLSGGDNQKYLDLISTACYTRFKHQKETINKGNVVLGERSSQTLIARENQDSKYVSGKNNLVVVDMEYEIPLNAIIDKNGDINYRIKHNKKIKKKAKVDFVVFDGKSFGLIEFKYQAMSMEANSDNSLREHYLDFKRIIEEDTSTAKLQVIRELIRRMQHLLDYEVLDQSWSEPFNQMKEKVNAMTESNYDSKLLWCGFYFVHDEKKNGTVSEKIKNQLSDLLDNKTFRVMCQIDNNEGKHVMTLTDEMTNVLKDL